MNQDRSTTKPIAKWGCLAKGLLIAVVVTLIIVVAGIVVLRKLENYSICLPEKQPLHYAAAQGNVTEIEHLLAEGQPIEGKGGLTSATPIFIAAMENQADAIDALIRHGANPNAKDRLQWAPLHVAVRPQYAHIDAMEVLLKAGANVDVRDKHLRTPLHRAAQFGKTNAVMLLLKFGADPLAKDENGWTPIDRSIGHIEESARQPEIAKLLQEAAERGNH
jgi:ankyrin repeat protein